MLSRAGRDGSRAARALGKWAPAMDSARQMIRFVATVISHAFSWGVRRLVTTGKRAYSYKKLLSRTTFPAWFNCSGAIFPVQGRPVQRMTERSSDGWCRRAHSKSERHLGA